MLISVLCVKLLLKMLQLHDREFYLPDMAIAPTEGNRSEIFSGYRSLKAVTTIEE